MTKFVNRTTILLAFLIGTAFSVQSFGNSCQRYFFRDEVQALLSSSQEWELPGATFEAQHLISGIIHSSVLIKIETIRTSDLPASERHKLMLQGLRQIRYAKGFSETELESLAANLILNLKEDIGSPVPAEDIIYDHMLVTTLTRQLVLVKPQAEGNVVSLSRDQFDNHRFKNEVLQSLYERVDQYARLVTKPHLDTPATGYAEGVTQRISYLLSADSRYTDLNSAAQTRLHQSLLRNTDSNTSALSIALRFYSEALNGR